MNFHKVIKLCEKCGFLYRTNGLVESKDIFKFGTTGLLLQDNLHREWFNSVVINKDIQIFPSDNDFNETFKFAKKMCLNTLPFGITQCLPRKEFQKHQEDKIDFSTCFEQDIVFECWMFTSPSNMHFFHQWQRERHIWWRKFSINPAKYVLTDIKNENETCRSVEILAQYQWGNQLLETITLYDDISNILNKKLKVDRNNDFKAQCVVSKIYSSTMFVNALCDAYDEVQFQDEMRSLFRLHRKLSPYKISFSIVPAEKSSLDELRDLSLFLCRELRKNHVSCLLLPSSYQSSLDSQWQQYDQMGVPYNLLLDQNTLKTGIAQLRSRDTTLKEQVHVTDLPLYVEKLFKNY